MTTDKRIRGRKLQEIRRQHFAQFPLCVACEALDKVRLAEELDHVIPLASGGLDEPANRQGLCKDCHLQKSLTEGSLDRRAATYPEWLQPATCHLTIVFGPPGSGKSWHARTNAKPADAVIDLDLIRAERSGKAIYQDEESNLSAAIWERNARLGKLCKLPAEAHAWFITTGAGKAIRSWWIAKLRPAETIVCRESYIVCAQRISADTRRPAHIKAQHLQAAAHWWRMERATSTPRRQAFDVRGEPVISGVG